VNIPTGYINRKSVCSVFTKKREFTRFLVLAVQHFDKKM
jgi:hypothetical protein